ncbi:MAG: SDR family oxidoreductase [Verrucomicrobiota bacterium JB023]|nr:SDR family oxidoreductase [Verrucomicrobiota bacterium JB023]
MKSENVFGPEGWTPDRISSLAGKTYLVTGANSGAGYQATRLLLAKEAKVVMLNRSAEKSGQAIESLRKELGQEVPVSDIRLDLSRLDSVRSAAEEILQKVPQIDALICNAAIAQIAKQELTKDGFESQLGVNHFGHFLLCALLFDRIEASEGRIVMVGSNAYKMGLKKIQFEDLNFDKNYTAWNSYAQSKLAQMMTGYELQRRVQAAGKRTQVYVCHPGASRTSLLRDSASLFNRVLWGVLSPFIAQSAEKGSWPEVMCAIEDGLKAETLYGPTKRAQMVGPVGECPLDPVALDQATAAKLWSISEEKTSCQWAV